MNLYQYSGRRSAFSYFLFGMLLLLAVLSIGRGIVRVLEPLGGIDGHAYWFNGHFVRQGKVPYSAYRGGEQLSVPVDYLDGKSTAELPVAQAGLSRTPANTPAMILFLTPLSFLSWPTTKIVLFIANLALMLVVPLLTVSLLPESIDRFLIVLICLVFYGLQGTRVAVWILQTTLLVFVLMLSSLLTMNRSWLLSGLMLGLALSKFTLAIPVFLFMIYRRQYRVLGISLLVQLSGLIVMALIGQASPLKIVLDYWPILLIHVDQPGIHLGSLFTNSQGLNLGIVIGGSLIFLGLLYRWLPPVKTKRTESLRLTFMEYHGLAALFLWTLLIVYHRVYDSVLVIVFVVLLIFGLSQERGWKLSKTGYRLLFIFLIAFLGVMMFPGTVMGNIFSDQLLETWLKFVSVFMTLMLLSSLAITLLLIRHLNRIRPLPKMEAAVTN